MSSSNTLFRCIIPLLLAFAAVTPLPLSHAAVADENTVVISFADYAQHVLGNMNTTRDLLQELQGHIRSGKPISAHVLAMQFSIIDLMHEISITSVHELVEKHTADARPVETIRRINAKEYTPDDLPMSTVPMFFATAVFTAMAVVALSDGRGRIKRMREETYRASKESLDLLKEFSKWIKGQDAGKKQKAERPKLVSSSSAGEHTEEDVTDCDDDGDDDWQEEKSIAAATATGNDDAPKH